MKTSSQVKTVQWLIDKNAKNPLDLLDPIQRNEAWNPLHKSNFIASILKGFPVESLLFEEVPNSKVYKVLDGKQRTITLTKFVNNEFKLHKSIRVDEIDGCELKGLTFDKLDPELQQTIRNYNLTFTIVRELSDEERELLFFMRNQAVALSNLELTRVRLGRKLLEDLKSLLSNPFFTETIKLSKIEKNKYADQKLLIQFLISEMEPESGFSSKERDNFVEETLRVHGVSPELNEKVSNVITYLHDAIGEDPAEEITKRIMKRIHIPMLYRVACDALEQNVSPEVFQAWILQFFSDIDIDDNDYKTTTNAGSARKANVKIRTEYAKKHFEDYLAQ